MPPTPTQTKPKKEAPKGPSKAAKIKSLMEDSGYTRAEAKILVEEGFE